MRKFIAILLSLLFFFTGAVASGYGSYVLFRTPETPIDSSYLMQFTDNEESYYLQKAAADIVFYIDSENEDYNSLLTLMDSEGNDLRDAKGLIFTIEKEKVESYTYANAVKKLNNAEFIEINDSTLNIKDLDVAVGDIIINEKASQAYKIVDILDNGTAIVNPPALDEIYTDLQVYGEYTWDVDQILLNPDLEIKIAENIRNSSFFDSLMIVAYADENEDIMNDPQKVGINVKIEPNRSDNTIRTEVEITLAPGSKGLLGISKLKNQEVTITLEFVTGLLLHCNIDGFAFDVSATQSNDFSWTVGLGVVKGSAMDKEINAAEPLVNLVEYQKITGELTKKLANVVKDKETGEIKLFNWKMPVASVPGLTFDAEVLLFADLELAANLTLNGHSSTRNTAGIRFNNYEFRTYSDEYRSKLPLAFSMIGSAELKFGIKMSWRTQMETKT